MASKERISSNDRHLIILFFCCAFENWFILASDAVVFLSSSLLHLFFTWEDESLLFLFRSLDETTLGNKNQRVEHKNKHYVYVHCQCDCQTYSLLSRVQILCSPSMYAYQIIFELWRAEKTKINKKGPALARFFYLQQAKKGKESR